MEKVDLLEVPKEPGIVAAEDEGCAGLGGRKSEHAHHVLPLLGPKDGLETYPRPNILAFDFLQFNGA